jgi:hypothetical protein
LAYKAPFCLFSLDCPAVKHIITIAFGWGQKVREKEKEKGMREKTHLFRSIVLMNMLAFLLFIVSKPAIAASTTPVVDGHIVDGLDYPKDGIPDKIATNLVQVLDVEKPTKPFECRGIIEFSIPGIPAPVAEAKLKLNVFDSHGPYPFIIDVFTYTGNGVLSLDDFNAGTLFTSFEYSAESSVTLDVTAFISNLYTSGDDFAGFNFQFAVPSTITLNGPFVAFNSLNYPPASNLTITPVPEPATLFLLGLGAVMLRRKR